MVFDQPFQTASPQQLLKITCVQWRRSYQAIPTGHTSSESTASSLFRSLLLSYWKQFPNWRHIWSKRYDMGPKGPLIVFWSIWIWIEVVMTNFMSYVIYIILLRCASRLLFLSFGAYWFCLIWYLVLNIIIWYFL